MEARLRCSSADTRPSARSPPPSSRRMTSRAASSLSTRMAVSSSTISTTRIVFLATLPIPSATIRSPSLPSCPPGTSRSSSPAAAGTAGQTWPTLMRPWTRLASTASTRSTRPTPTCRAGLKARSWRQTRCSLSTTTALTHGTSRSARWCRWFVRLRSVNAPVVEMRTAVAPPSRSAAATRTCSVSPAMPSSRWPTAHWCRSNRCARARWFGPAPLRARSPRCSFTLSRRS
mmetsp:Transcript_57640/g.125199  ORF Transcript_57640/g.125199 Transcript_57640/m.125199 type:complete len:231 (+) Transcript_57640:1233-1925(+)